MQPVLYAGLRNPGRDKAIADAMASMPTTEVCEQFSINPSTARKAAKRVADLCIFELRLTGGGVRTCRSARSPRSPSGVQPWAPIGTSAAPSGTWSCRSGV
ncbi:hypothetical protein PtoMrB4_23110 [Metapseudomonas otitidis]|uniref:Uncharacterized protein n=1 Tax=Metapseudomonas otitidis TaxID=319939 RepID=A0A679GQL4_9GAMM|nr:hypothetical protein PtoMrB4_23110 [Pseudomonas otitidis]